MNTPRNTPKQYSRLIEPEPFFAYWQLYRDGKHVAGFRTSQELYSYLHNQHSQSVDWLCKHEGYEIRQNTPPEHTVRYAAQHQEACINPRPGFERALVRMLRGWLEYAEVYEGRYESRIGDDGILGPEWEAIGEALRGLLNGEAGRLDCGTIDSIILDAMRDAGVDVDSK